MLRLAEANRREKEIQGHVRELDDESFRVVDEAVRRLALLRAVSALEPIFESWTRRPRSEPYLYRRTFVALRPESTEFLLQKIGSDVNEERALSADALSEIALTAKNEASYETVRRIVDALAEHLLNHDPGDASQTREPLGRLGDAAIPRLIEIIRHSDNVWRLAALGVLAYIERPTPLVAEAITELWKTDAVPHLLIHSLDLADNCIDMSGESWNVVIEPLLEGIEPLANHRDEGVRQAADRWCDKYLGQGYGASSEEN